MNDIISPENLVYEEAYVDERYPDALLPGLFAWRSS